jgi:precorrin-2 dehydrogenase/sirohydrochlorin ferrochelatase
MPRPLTLFPMVLKLDGRSALVAGAGAIAESKIESLLRSGAVVRVVAPQATATIAAWARESAIVWEARRFNASDLQGVFVVIAATSSPRVNHSIFRQAQRLGILCNVVDDPEYCDFYYPAVVRRGQLQIAISTGGQSPALAQRLRQDLERQFGDDYGPWVEHLGITRARLLTSGVGPERRRRALHKAASHQEFTKYVRHGITRKSGGSPLRTSVRRQEK